MFAYNSRNPFHKNPFGAIKTNESVTFRVTLPLNYNNISIILKSDDGYYREQEMSVEHLYHDNKVFSTTLALDVENIYFYMFDLKYNNQFVFNNSKGDGIISNQGNWFQLTVYTEDFYTPNDFKGKTFYQIFPDRFYQSNKTPLANISDRVYPTNKSDIPLFGDKTIGSDYYGGNLQGIIEKLDYLKELNIDCIYLNPIFEAHANHRYNTANYMKIDKDLGTLEDFEQLVAKAKACGIDIILDGVFSHVGSDSIYFNKENRYDTLGAYNSTESPYRSWFDFDSKYKNGYRAWWDFDTLPEINEFDEQFIDYICGENGILKYWLSKGIKGYRLDVADELPDEFLEHLRKSVKSCDKENIIIGEVWEDASNKISFGKRRKYLLGNGLDSVMNYPFKDSILSFSRNLDGHRFCDEIITICENYPKEAVDTALNSLSTHDTMRALTVISSDTLDIPREIQSHTYLSSEEYEIGIKKLVNCYALLFTLPGNPCVYYGDEIGMQGYKDPFNRKFFEWDNIDNRILSEIKNISDFRANKEIFKIADIHFIYSDTGVVAFVRHQEDIETLTAVNFTDNDTTFNYKNKDYTVKSNYYLLEVIYS